MKKHISFLQVMIISIITVAASVISAYIVLTIIFTAIGMPDSTYSAVAALYYKSFVSPKTSDDGTGFIIDDNIDFSLNNSAMADDFEYIYNCIIQNSPSADYYKELYGYSFSERRDMYKDSIERCDDPVELYGTLSAVLCDLPSCHCYVVPPEYNSLYWIDRGAQFGNLELLIDHDLAGYTSHWNEILNTAGKQFIKSSVTCCYKDGDYILLSDMKADGIITKINNMDINNYVNNHLFAVKNKYDFINKRPYRSSFLLYNEPVTGVSEEVQIAIILNDNTEAVKKMYIDHAADAAVSYYNNFGIEIDDLSESVSEECYAYCDSSSDVGYIFLSLFDIEKKDKYDEIISNALTCDNIILDLRSCSGGHSSFITDYLYGKFYSQDLDVELDFYRLYTANNNRITSYHESLAALKDSLDCQIYPEISRDRKFCSETATYSFKGNGSFDKNVYILISNNTASAADTFAEIMRSNKKAVVIGTNTLGEGRGGGYLIEKCPNSKLCFVYNPYLEFNSDGTLNNVYGTSPDIFLTMTRESLDSLNDILISGGDVNSYESHRQWDNVLNYAVDMIEKN